MASRSLFHLLWIHAQERYFWLLQEFYLQFLEGPPYCSASWLYQFSFPSTVYEGSLSSMPSLALEDHFLWESCQLQTLFLMLMYNCSAINLELPGSCLPHDHAPAMCQPVPGRPPITLLSEGSVTSARICSGVERPTFNSHCQCQREGQVLPSQMTLGNTPRALHLD